MAKKRKATKRRTARPTLHPAKIAINPRTGKVRIFVSKSVQRRVSNPTGKIVSVTKDRFERYVRPLLRAPYNLLPYAVWKRTKSAKGMYLLFKGDQLIKAGSKPALVKQARRFA